MSQNNKQLQPTTPNDFVAARSTMGSWHHNVDCLSVRPSVCLSVTHCIVANDTCYSKVPEQVNRNTAI